MLASRIKHEDLGQILMLILVKVLFQAVSECDSLFRFNGIQQSRQTLICTCFFASCTLFYFETISNEKTPLLSGFAEQKYFCLQRD